MGNNGINRPFKSTFSWGRIGIFLYPGFGFSTNYPLMMQIYEKILQIPGSFGIKFVYKSARGYNSGTWPLAETITSFL
jgi:hypothetical protein